MLFQKLSIALQRQNARSLIQRIPSVPDVIIMKQTEDNSNTKSFLSALSMDVEEDMSLNPNSPEFVPSSIDLFQLISAKRKLFDEERRSVSLSNVTPISGRVRKRHHAKQVPATVSLVSSNDSFFVSNDFNVANV